jgi:poly(A) polymerase
MREIWMMQPRFDRRSGSGPYSLVEQARYRAGFDFLVLRADVGEVDFSLVDWWEDFALGDEDERKALLEQVRESHRRAPKVHRMPRAQGAEASPVGAEPALEGEPLPAAAKKRRRRRKPKSAANEQGGAAAASNDTAA